MSLSVVRPDGGDGRPFAGSLGGEPPSSPAPSAPRAKAARPRGLTAARRREDGNDAVDGAAFPRCRALAAAGAEIVYAIQSKRVAP
jgi:hypothetical protein